MRKGKKMEKEKKENLKEKYEKATMEIILFDTEDVIISSGDDLPTDEWN